DENIASVLANRDPRLTETIAPELRLLGEVGNSSSSGYASHKFLNESLKNSSEATGTLNQTDAPVIRFGEVLLNYAEACAELGTLTNEDLDKSINKLRSRPGVNLPDLEVVGNQSSVSGVIFDDPERDPSVTPILWEIRRER